MKSKANHFKIGLFVLGSMTVVIVGLLAVSSETFKTDVVRIETYINESVQGLSEGSAMLHRGVAIGRIDKITFVPLEYPIEVNSPEFKQYGRYVMVVVAVDRSKMPGLNRDPAVFRAMMESEVRNGLRLKLTYQGITGLLTLETDYVDGRRYPPLQVPWKPRYLYIPSAPSVITSFTLAVESVFQRFEKFDLEGISQKMGRTLEAIEKAAGEVKLEELRGSALTLVEDLRRTNRQVQQVLTSQTPPAGTIPDAFRQFTATLSRIEQVVATHEDDIDKILADLRAVSANLRDLSELLKNDPAKILLSGQPAHSEVVK